MIPTKTRLQYANGYLELGMLDEPVGEVELCGLGGGAGIDWAITFRKSQTTR